MSRLFEYGFILCMGIAIIGVSGDYMLAIGVMLPSVWLHWRNREIAELKSDNQALQEQLVDVTKHRDAVRDIYDGTTAYREQLQDENSRLRNLCFQMRMTFRRMKGRGMQCTPYNWPNTDCLPPVKGGDK